MRLIKSTPKGKQRVYDIEVADVHNFYANGINVHNCATDGGVSVIMDDGSVVDHTSSHGLHQKTEKVSFTDDNRIAIVGFDYNTQTRSRFYSILPIRSSDTVETTSTSVLGNRDALYGETTAWSSFPPGNGILPIPTVYRTDYQYEGFIERKNGNVIIANNGGLSIVAENKEAPHEGMVAGIRSSFNSGYQVGDIKGAFLSDTDTTNVTGTELVTNGTFDSDTTGWAATNGATLTQQNNGNPGGNINVASGPISNGYAYQSNTVVIGKYYTLSFDHYHVDGSEGYVNIGTTTGASQYVYQPLGTSSSWTTYSFTIKATSTNLFTGFYSRPNGNVRYDNISLREADPDRSVNNKGLQVFGTIAKSAVSPGADLVGYGFNGSNSNYLLQPYNSDLDFGTGDFSVMYWFYQSTSPTTYQDVVSRTTSPLSDGNWTIQHFPNDSVYMYHRVSGSWNTLGISGSDITHNGWNFIAVTRSSSICRMYFDGVQVDSRINAYTMTNTSAQLKISTRVDSTLYPLESGNSVALVRISASAPSPEQIKKIYEDEKVLFQENAACTLYGSSDAVTALAYDEVNDLLHVGTSSGRSDFNGLRRINNTTTAVTTAISAYDGLIAAQ